MLDLLPVTQDVGGVRGHNIAEDMGMTADEFGVQVGGDVLKGEITCLRGHLRVEEHLQEQIAQLVLQIGPRAAFNGVEDLVGLL